MKGLELNRDIRVVLKLKKSLRFEADIGDYIKISLTLKKTTHKVCGGRNPQRSYL